jgi:hypothetical protein
VLVALSITTLYPAEEPQFERSCGSACSSAMSQSSIDPSATPPVAMRRCPVCGEPMLLLLVEPTYQHGYDVRTFECSKCAYAEIALIHFDETWGMTTPAREPST